MSSTPTVPAARPSAVPVPDVVVAVYADETDLTAAVTHLKKAGFDMATISVLGKGMSEQRHVVGFETPESHTARWAKWGGLWGWIFGAFILVPGVGHVAIGGYLLFVLASTVTGALGGALTGALTGMGIPEDGLPVYEADLRAEHFLVVAHGTPAHVEQARALLAETRHARLDHHQHAAWPAPSATTP